ncbi:PIN domain-containing protein [Streptomyces exfoliatus]|uniref:PIN domain-containing protein n=1 Tax=Streptomyces exfoliatus TaxID=1905 RepID=UPI003C2B8C1C
MTSSFLAAFEGLWRRPASDYEEGVKKYTVVVDTNVLLELYRFTPDARKELLQALRRIGDRLWIPHQVAAEYYNRRVDAIKDHLALYASVPKKLDEHEVKVLQDLYAFAKRCSLSSEDREALVAPAKEAFARIKGEMERHAKTFDLSLEGVVAGDPVLKELGEILDGKTGEGFSPEECSKLIEEYEKRVQEERPPGFRDSGKKENPHGDFFVWEQVLRRAEELSSPVLFVSNDVKDDWVRKEAGLIVGARPELVAEIKERCGVDFLMLQLGAFLQIAKKELGASVSESTVAQAENLAASLDRSTSLSESDLLELIASLRAIRDGDLIAVEKAREALDADPNNRDREVDLEFSLMDSGRAGKMLTALKSNSQPVVLDGRTRFVIDAALLGRARQLVERGSKKVAIQRRLAQESDSGEAGKGRLGEADLDSLRARYTAVRAEEAHLLGALERSHETQELSFRESTAYRNIQRLREEGLALELRMKRLNNADRDES